MNNRFTNAGDFLPTWMVNSGPDIDVVLLTRFTLSRNSQDFCFPGMMESGEKIELLRISEDAIRDLPGQWKGRELQSLSSLEMRLYTEQLYLPSSADDQNLTGRRLVFEESGSRSILLNWEDHLVFQEAYPGFPGNEVPHRLESADRILEKHFSYAVSMDLGYLRSRIDKTGNGMRAEALLHLPRLSRDSRFGEVLSHAQREGLTLSTFGGSGEESLAQVYLLSIEGQLGLTEADQMEKFRLVAGEFIHYEREARSAAVETGGIEYADLLWRDFGTLANCRLLGFRESLELYSRVRTGQSTGILPGPVSDARLFFLTQPGHLYYLSEKSGKEFRTLPPDENYPADNTIVSALRAEVFREAINGV